MGKCKAYSKMTCLCEDKEYFREDFFFYLPANFEHNKRITYVVTSKFNINETQYEPFYIMKNCKLCILLEFRPLISKFNLPSKTTKRSKLLLKKRNSKLSSKVI